MRAHLATYLDDFARFGRDIAVVRYTGVRRRMTRYAELAALSRRFAALLVQRGIVEGDRVLIWGENGAEWIAAFYGCMLRGVLAVPLDAYGSAEFAGRIAVDVRPSLVVGDAALLSGLSGDWAKLAFEDWDTAQPGEGVGAVAGLSRSTPLQILFTSGTTGEPKGIVHTHGNVLASVEPIEQGAAKYMRYERIFHPLRFLHTLPLSHVFGQTMGLWMPALFAAEVHFESKPAAARMVETIRRERISVVASVPRVLALLMGHLEATYPGLGARLAAAKGIKAWERWWRFRDIHGAFGLKFWAFVTGGGALPGPVEQFWNGLGFVLVQGYGMTETAALITLNHPFHVARGSIGKLLPGREVKLGPDGEVLVRGPMISTATWRAGAMQQRDGEWLATGDLAIAETTGDFHFVGRKSEVIVTGAGVNIHPEDLEAAIEVEPEVAACAVVAMETVAGPEPCAVLALRGQRTEQREDAGARITAILQRANERLADFQHVRRWKLWPEPDLPRTSTGKVKRAAVTAWLASQSRGNGTAGSGDADSKNWLLALIGQITGEAIPTGGDELSLEGDFHLDSLGRVQLLAALEERLGVGLVVEEFAAIHTVGELRRWTGRADAQEVGLQRSSAAPLLDGGDGAADMGEPQEKVAARQEPTIPLPVAALPTRSRYVYPRWPWWLPIHWLRVLFLECLMRPLVWLLAVPEVRKARTDLDVDPQKPQLIIANHVTAYDVPLLLFALPGAVRRRTAVAMSGEMLEDFRHGRNQQPAWLDPLGPFAWLLMTALFNVFPLPRHRDFQRSFAHAGEALDRGFNVIVFPEGTRSADGTLARFRPGIGLLVRQASAAVLPMALKGLGALKVQGRGWFRSGALSVRVGEPVRFGASETEAEITALLHAEVESLLADSSETAVR